MHASTARAILDLVSRAELAGSVEAYHAALLVLLATGFVCDVAVLDEVRSAEAAHPRPPVAGGIMLGLMGPPGPSVGIWLGRFDRGFSEQDRVLAELFSLHLQVAELRVRRAAARAVLTARERQVLDLVADGASNADVARVIVVSPKTVKKHLEHIYAKLGVRSRAEAVQLVQAPA